MNTFLKQIQYKLPLTTPSFMNTFMEYLSPVGNVSDTEIRFSLSSSDYFPETSLQFIDTSIPQVTFVFNDNSHITIEIANKTGITKKSPHTYSALSIQDFVKRISAYALTYIDHTGFNLPYFDGVHPDIVMLRTNLAKTALYHRFPEHLEKNVNWDFILPASVEEIQKQIPLNYNQIRRPKIEIVSFEKSSTPLIQFDIQIYGNYEEWSQLFPEGLAIPELKSIWIYIENDFGIDICFVLNEVHTDDWSYEFKGCRLI